MSQDFSQMSLDDLRKLAKAISDQQTAKLEQELAEAKQLLDASKADEANAKLSHEANIKGIKKDNEEKRKALIAEFDKKEELELQPIRDEIAKIEDKYKAERQLLVDDYSKRGIQLPKWLLDGFPNETAWQETFEVEEVHSSSASRKQNNPPRMEKITPEMRTKIIELLKQQPDKTLRVSKINERLGLSGREIHMIIEPVKSSIKFGGKIGNGSTMTWIGD